MKKILFFTALVAILLSGCGNKNKALVNAIRTDNTVVIEQRLKAENANKLLNQNVTPLMFAIRTGASMDTIKLIVEKGANINLANAKKQDPIYYAVYYNRLDALQFLVSKKATSVTSLEQLKVLARQKGNDKIANYLETVKF